MGSRRKHLREAGSKTSKTIQAEIKWQDVLGGINYKTIEGSSIQIVRRKAWKYVYRRFVGALLLEIRYPQRSYEWEKFKETDDDMPQQFRKTLEKYQW